MSRAQAALHLAEVLGAAGRERDAVQARVLADRLGRSVVDISVIGQTSAGKTTLINAALDVPLLPVGVRPTTAAVVRVELNSEGRRETNVLDRTGLRSSLPWEEFLRQCEAPSPATLWLELSASGRLSNLAVFDTPGYDSEDPRHLAILRQIVPESEAVVVVVSYRVGVGQAEQELFEDVGEAISHDPGLPVLLVVNRAPVGTTLDDRRVREIALNVTDSLGVTPALFVVPSSTPRGDLRHVHVDAHGMWEMAQGLSQSPTRLAEVEHRLTTALLMVVDEASEWVDLALDMLDGDAEQIAQVRDTIGELERAREASLDLVRRTDARMRREVPRMISTLLVEERRALSVDVESSDKWLGAADCGEWMACHAIPFAVRRVGTEVGDKIGADLEQLDAELKEIANTAVAALSKRASVRSANAQRLAERIGFLIGKKLAGGFVRAGLGGIGGVGGVAAGAGNLVKMIVSRAGRLVGKTFGREIYRAIGRAFTKKFIARLSVGIGVLVETLMYLREVKVWRGRLMEEVGKALSEWETGAQSDTREHLTECARANLRAVSESYNDLLAEHQEHLNSCARDVGRKRDELTTLRRKLTEVRNAILEGMTT